MFPKMIYVLYLFLMHHGLQMFPKMKIKWGEIWEATPQDHVDQSKHPEIADLTINTHEYHNEMDLIGGSKLGSYYPYLAEMEKNLFLQHVKILFGIKISINKNLSNYSVTPSVYQHLASLLDSSSEG